jgi:hypothetical protein
LVHYSVEADLVKTMINIKVDDVWTPAKVQVQNSVIAETQKILDHYNSGIQIFGRWGYGI